MTAGGEIRLEIVEEIFQRERERYERGRSVLILGKVILLFYCLSQSTQV